MFLKSLKNIKQTPSNPTWVPCTQPNVRKSYKKPKNRKMGNDLELGQEIRGSPIEIHPLHHTKNWEQSSTSNLFENAVFDDGGGGPPRILMKICVGVDDTGTSTGSESGFFK